MTILFLLAILPGCAAIFSGTSDAVTFTSEPTQARVVVDGEVVGTTPCSVNISKKVREVTFQHDGYPERVVPVDASFGFGWFLLDLLFTPGFGLVGIVPDLITQAWMDLQAIVHCDFTKPLPEQTKPEAKNVDTW